MTDTKQAALELARECGSMCGEILCVTGDEIAGYYNAARKPLEEENAELIARFDVEFRRVKELEQQLIATQEAYQRAADMLMLIYRGNKVWNLGSISGALANPPSIEMVERKKLEDEIAVLGTAKEAFRPKHKNDYRLAYYVQCDIASMIAERKAKLEKMK
jgi:hypothetical protein